MGEVKGMFFWCVSGGEKGDNGGKTVRG